MRFERTCRGQWALLQASVRGEGCPLRSHALKRLLVESAGLAVALGLALIGLGRLVATDRAYLLFDDANSVLLELVHRSSAEGLPADWVMSAALFVFPEIPLYELIRSVSPTVQQAIIANALVYFMLTYTLLRAIVSQLLPSTRGVRAVAIALSGIAILVTALYYESSASRDSLELVSGLLFGGYYNGTTLAMFASVALVAFALNRRDSESRLGFRCAFWMIALLGALATMSNPLYVSWVSIPLGVALGALTLLDRSRWRSNAWIAVAAVGGPVLGLLARIPLSRYISAPTDRYVHGGHSPESALFYFDALLDMAGPLNLGELLVLSVLTVCSALAVYLAFRRRPFAAAGFAGLFGAIAPVAVVALNIALGTETVRYLQPIYFAQVVSLLVVLAHAAAPESAFSAALRASTSRRRAATAAGVVVLLGVGLAAVPSTAGIATAATERFEDVACLENWVDGRDLTGVGTFWTIRALSTHGDGSVHLVQSDEEFEIDPWLVNLSAYYGIDASYVLVGGRDSLEFVPAAKKLLGEPEAVVQCLSFQILDYVGTPSAAVLSAVISESAAEEALRRGFPTP